MGLEGAAVATFRIGPVLIDFTLIARAVTEGDRGISERWDPDAKRWVRPGPGLDEVLDGAILWPERLAALGIRD